VFNEESQSIGKKKMPSDKDLIEQLGGATKVAALLGCSVQRVQNWKDRGIPAQVRLDRPDVFPLPRSHAAAEQVASQPQ
jgi:hypothetical protein